MPRNQTGVASLRRGLTGTGVEADRLPRLAPLPTASVRAGACVDRRAVEDHLFTAALIGLAVGAGLTYMLRRGPSGRRPVSPVVMGMSRGAAWAGKNAMRAGRKGGRWAAKYGSEMWDRIPRDEIREQMG